METFDSIEELSYPQDYGKNSKIILDGLNEKNLLKIKYKRCLNENILIIYLFL